LKNPIYIANNYAVPEKVSVAKMENNYTIRKEITPDNFKDSKLIEKIIDEGVKKIMFARLKDFNNNAKEAFSNLEKNPIWLNKEKGIAIKRVTISGVSNAEALHYKKDHLGNAMLDAEGKKIPVDFVSTGNNHHVAIYRDENGKLQEKVVSFYEAVARVNARIPIIIDSPKTIWNMVIEKPEGTYPQALIDNLPNENWLFLFTMKQNEMFVFPSPSFDPTEIDLLNPDNYAIISPNLYRVQKIGSLLSGFWFRHHLETQININKELKGITYKVIQSVNNLEKIVKVKINHIGKIVSKEEM
jgi:CRISPR-associated endonuclease Csn1